MPRDRSFWQNLTIVGLFHLGLLIGIAHWSASAKKPLGSGIIWMDGGVPDAAREAVAPTAKEERVAAPPTTEETPADEKEEEQTTVIAATNDMRFAIPSPTPKETPSVTPRPNPSPKPSPKPTPKKSKASPTPKAATITAKKKPSAKEVSVKPAKPAAQSGASATSAAGSNGHASGAGNASQFSWYGNMLHDRFFSEWDQPTSVVATGAKMSVLVRLRIEKDGRVSDFALVRPSGNVVVDESVAAVAKRVTKVDPLPVGLGNGGHYDVNNNFELNAD
ncbi:MAG: TonB family protein [Chthoniobacterales bacterium]